MDWKALLIHPLVVVIFTFAIVRAWDWLWRRKRLEAHRTALAAEIEICNQHAKTHNEAGIQAPSYRLPFLVYSSSLTDLIANGVLSAEGIDALIRFYNQVETLNRGLDQINEARKIDSTTFTDEHSRNRIKAEELVSKFYPPARDAVAPKRPCIRAWFQGGP